MINIAIWVGNFKSEYDFDDYINSGEFEKEFNFEIITGLEPESRYIENNKSLIELIGKFSFGEKIVKLIRKDIFKKEYNAGIIQYDFDYFINNKNIDVDVLEKINNTKIEFIGAFSII